MDGQNGIDGTRRPALRLTIELVPSTAWGKNVRSEVTPAEWDRIRRRVIEAAVERCEICGAEAPGGRGLHCHEVFEYTADYVQRLVGLRGLCGECHAVKHIGLAAQQGRFERALKHLARVNGWSLTAARGYVDRSMALWQERSRREWRLDLAWLDKFASPDVGSPVS